MNRIVTIDYNSASTQRQLTSKQEELLIYCQISKTSKLLSGPGFSTEAVALYLSILKIVAVRVVFRPKLSELHFG